MENKLQGEYRELMEKVSFSKEEKEDMVQRLVECTSYGKGTVEEKYYPHKNTILEKAWTRSAVAACIAICLLVTGVAGASAGVLKPVSDVFEKVFHLTNDNQKLAEEIGSPLGKTAVSNGVRVTADAVIADKYAYAVVFSVEREDGKMLDEGKNLAADAWGFRDSTVNIKSTEKNISNWHTEYSYDENPKDPAIQYVLMGTYDKEIGNGISVSLSGLWNYDKSSGRHNIVTNGEWNMQLPVKKTDVSINLGTQTATINGNKVSIDEIVLSPLSYHISCSIKSKGKDEKLNSEKFHNLFGNGPAELEFKNGKKINLCDNGLSEHFEDNYIEATYEDIFETLIDLKDIKSIHIGDIEIPAS